MRPNKKTIFIPIKEEEVIEEILDVGVDNLGDDDELNVDEMIDEEEADEITNEGELSEEEGTEEEK